eukprot:4649140-Pyramimonas_sp.AAC.1
MRSGGSGAHRATDRTTSPPVRTKRTATTAGCRGRTGWATTKANRCGLRGPRSGSCRSRRLKRKCGSWGLRVTRSGISGCLLYTSPSPRDRSLS